MDKYIVVSEAWEYNDEIYYQPEGEPYNLAENKLYSLEEASKLCEELNEKYGFEGYTSYEDDEENLPKIKPYKIIKLTE